MADDLRKLISDGEKLGFTFLGQKAHGGHLQFLHTTGVRITASSTPSDSHAWANTRKDFERVAGERLPRDNKGRHTFKKVLVTNMTRTVSEVQSANIVDGLLESADRIRRDFRLCVLQPNRSNAQRARELLGDFTEVRAELAAHHRVISPIY